MSKKRQKRIDAADATGVKPLDSYLPNRIANALHPAVQYVKIAAIEERGADVKTFTFVPDEEKGTKALAYFAAGQYLSVELTIGKAKINRPYSISSSPKDASEGKYQLTIKRDKNGKPRKEGVYFNVSHGGEYVVLALAPYEVGVDVEPVKGTEEDIFSHIATEEERACDDFYLVWTLKESLLKCVGSGIVSDLRAVPAFPLGKKKSLQN